MSAYLATVSIGKYHYFSSSTTSITGRRIPIWTFVDPTTGRAAEARRVLPSVIRFAERRFGAYPFDSSGMFIDNADVGYVLETQSRPFFPYSADIVTLVHEIAHQWYGNSVTLTDWHDIWLAEGFATYAEWMWGRAHGGSTPAWRFDRLYETPETGDLWHPAPTEFTDPADLFGTPAYTRGGDDPPSAARKGRRPGVLPDPRPGPASIGTRTSGPKTSSRSRNGSPAMTSTRCSPTGLPSTGNRWATEPATGAEVAQRD